MSGHFERETETMERIRKLFAERDEEYAKKESLYKERKEALCRQETACEERKEELQKREEALAEKEKQYAGREAVLLASEEKIEKEKENLKEEKERQEKEKDHAMLQISILKEETRNEKLKAQRLSEEYENRLLQLKEGGIAMENEGGALPEEPLSFMEQKRQLVARMEECEVLKEQCQTLKEENEALKEEKERLQKEKGELFRKLMMKDMGEKEESGQPQPDKASGPLSKEEITEEKQPVLETVVVSETVGEDLTAGHLLDHLQQKGAECELLHAKAGEMVRMALHGLIVMVTFENPPSFHIHKKVKQNRRVKQMLEKINIQGMEVKASYHMGEQEVVLTGQFDRQDSPAYLMEKIEETMKAYFEW